MHSQQTGLTPKDLKVFQTVYEFVDNIHKLYGNSKAKNGTLHALNLYHRLLVNIQFKDNDNMIKHVNAFREFCLSNRAGIEKRNVKMFTTNKVKYCNSDKIYIDLYWIFQKASSDEDITNTCWEYLLTCAALLDDESNAQYILNNMMKNLTNGDANSLSDIANMLGGSGKNNPLLSQLSGMMSVLNSLPNKTPETKEEFLELFELPQLKTLLSMFSTFTGVNIVEIPLEFKELSALFFVKLQNIKNQLTNEVDKQKRIEILTDIINKI